MLNEKYHPFTTAADRQEKILNKQIAELRRIADAAEQQAKLAKEEAESAKKDAEKSRRQSRIANILALVSVTMTVSAWLLPKELIAQAISGIFGLG